MATQYGSNFRGGSVPLEDLLLNVFENTGDAETENGRDDFGGFPETLAIKVCDWSIDLTDDDISEIKSQVESSDPNDTDSLNWLVKSICENGVQTALEVYSIGEKLVVVDGNRRCTASHIARRVYQSDMPQSIRCTVVEKSKVNAAQILLRQWNSGHGKKKLDHVEQAKLVSRMIDKFGTIEKVSEVTALSVQALNELLALLNLSPEAQQAVKGGQVKAGVAIEFVRSVENEVSNPLTAARTASDAIVQAVEKAASQGKNKASLKDVKAEVSGEGAKLSKKELLLDGAALLNEVDWRNLSDTQILAALRMLGLDRENSALRAELLEKLGE